MQKHKIYRAYYKKGDMKAFIFSTTDRKIAEQFVNKRNRAVGYQRYFFKESRI